MRDDPHELLPLFPFQKAGFILGLQVDPHLHVSPEIPGQTHGGIRADAALFVQDFMNPCGGDAKGDGKGIRAQAELGSCILRGEFLRDGIASIFPPNDNLLLRHHMRSRLPM